MITNLVWFLNGNGFEFISKFSRVTFPSKTFDYLNAGLRLISTKAAGVEFVMGPAAIYLEEESSIGLGLAVERAMFELQTDYAPRLEALESDYSLSGTVRRLSRLFKEASIA